MKPLILFTFWVGMDVFVDFYYLILRSPVMNALVSSFSF